VAVCAAGAASLHNPQWHFAFGPCGVGSMAIAEIEAGTPPSLRPATLFTAGTRTTGSGMRD
jgi:hypothetical protein